MVRQPTDARQNAVTRMTQMTENSNCRYSNESALNEQSEKISIWASTYKTFLIS